MSEFSTMYQLLQQGADDAVAFAAPGQPSMAYSVLRKQVQKTIQTLRGYGVQRNDRVAIVLPNGPEMASSFVSVAAGATTAPLNPAYQKKEFDFYLSDLNAKVLIVEQDSTSPAVESAKELNIPIMEIKKLDVAGAFEFKGAELENGKVSAEDTLGFSEPDDVALVLHTSGTTSRPKIVPLTNQNVCASAWNIQQTLALQSKDKCMNMMPLFHIHGLIAAVLSSLNAGASIFCTPGFNALKVFTWFEEATPTWYTAVPTMHQAILSRSKNNQTTIDQTQLRFIRSSSSSLPPQVMQALEDTFKAPVIEAYGMTEAAHQMTSNPLPPLQRKPGSVGIAAGPKVAIMDEAGQFLPLGSKGEVVIQGKNVTLGYENNPQANEANFTKGWFRTGDQGVMDEGGYLTITGRLKEIINRGGEKISPREVDDVLMDHPAIQQVVTFALPHEKLGEEVAAAVVLKEGESANEKDIRQFAGSRLANFKIPRKIVFLEEIPKGATGKLQRIGLAEKLGLVS